MDTNYGAGEEFIDWSKCNQVLSDGDKLVRELRRIDSIAERSKKVRDYLQRHSAAMGNRPMTIVRRQLYMLVTNLDKNEAARRLQTIVKQSRTFVNNKRHEA